MLLFVGVLGQNATIFDIAITIPRMRWSSLVVIVTSFQLPSDESPPRPSTYSSEIRPLEREPSSRCSGILSS